jgi:hypothetical protein
MSTELNDMDNRVVSRYGFTHRQLSEAFEQVRDPDDWKAPISVSCSGEAVLVVCEAIRYFTATEPRVSLDVQRMRYLIESEGYRNGPAGDH